MALLDSTFLFEIAVEELKSYVGNNQFLVKSEFTDIFSVVLKNPIQTETLFTKQKKPSKNKAKVKNAKEATAGEVKSNLPTSQSIMFSSNIDRLMSHMLQYPMEISLWNIKNPKKRIGSTLIPWNPAFVEFLARLYKLEEPPPVVINDIHNIFDEFSSKRMAAIQLNITLTHLKDGIPTHLKSFDETAMISEVISKPVKKISTIKKPSAPAFDTGTGIIKTFYSGGKRKRKSVNTKRNTKKGKVKLVQAENPKVPEKKSTTDDIELVNLNTNSRINKSIVSLIKSDSDIDRCKQINLVKTKSCSSIKRLNALNYVFGDRKGPFGNRIYTVGYFTVKTTGSKSTASDDKDSESSFESKPKYKFKLCSDDCPSKRDSGRCAEDECSLDLPADAADLITVTKCKDMKCLFKKDREPTDPRDDRIMIDIGSLKTPCCMSETVEEIVGNMKASVKIGKHPCFCACECTFGFGQKTTYCKVCGGYESPGESINGKPQYLMPPACPIYHKITKKPGSNSGSETKTRKGKSVESSKDPKKGKKKLKKDDRFKFNYGYKAPQIGHSQCAMACTGTLNNVPKSMGWLWTADNVPALKFRPLWKPGAINKFVLRLLRMAKNPGEVSKKRRKDTGKKKRPPKRPLLVVHKKDGEYSVTMETMKAYGKPRALNQQPYEDKAVLTYTIGRTEEENRERRKKKERAQRRLEKDQREFIQSAFRDMCQEICLKTYQQALGILPNAENPECPCYPATPGPDQTNLDRSCSCSEDAASLASDTDSDEWIVEFTPPNARFDPTYKGKKTTTSDNETQYTYLDYRVKLVDRFGNPVPRFFKGLDGKQQCSDLGGFWSPDHQWQEINVDGYVAPDGRWAPLNFIGPNGEQVDSDTGKFQAMNGKWLVVGVDGFIDSQGKWKFYPRRNIPDKKKKRRTPTGVKGAGDKGTKQTPNYEKSERSWSCFGDASPLELSKMGIVGHGPDKRLLYKTLKDLLARGQKDIKLPEVSRVPRSPASRKGRRAPAPAMYIQNTVCKHPVPSDKGILVDERGRKTYFKSKEWKNFRPDDRLHDLEDQGKSLSTFHEPCFHSFTNSETMRQHLRERLINMAAGVHSPAHDVHAYSFTTSFKRPEVYAKSNKGVAQFLKKNMVEVATQAAY